MRLSLLMTGVALEAAVVADSDWRWAERSLAMMRSIIFRERGGRSMRKSPDASTESLDGVRVVKGYHAEESEGRKCFRVESSDCWTT